MCAPASWLPINDCSSSFCRPASPRNTSTPRWTRWDPAGTTWTPRASARRAGRSGMSTSRPSGWSSTACTAWRPWRPPSGARGDGHVRPPGPAPRAPSAKLWCANIPARLAPHGLKTLACGEHHNSSACTCPQQHTLIQALRSLEGRRPAAELRSVRPARKLEVQQRRGSAILQRGCLAKADVGRSMRSPASICAVC